jgi:hypothetical protein
MFLLKQILPAVLLAMSVAAGLQAVAWWLGAKRAREAFTPLALGLGYFCGHFLITGWTPFPPTDTTNWLPYFGLAAAGLGIFWGAFPEKGVARVSLLALLAAGALRLLLEPKFRHGWTTGQGWIWVICLGFGVALLGILLSALIRHSSITTEFPLVVLLIGTGTSVALMLSGSFLLGQFGAVFTGAIFGALIFALRRPVAMEAIAPAISVLLGLLLVSGYFFAELPGSSAILLAGAPVLALIPTGRLSAWPSAALRIGLVSLPVAAAVVLAFRASPPLYY